MVQTKVVDGCNGCVRAVRHAAERGGRARCNVCGAAWEPEQTALRELPPRWSAARDLRVLARWLPSMGARGVNLDPAHAGPGHNGARGGWFEGRGEVVDRRSAEFGHAVAVRRRLDDARLAVSEGLVAQGECASCAPQRARERTTVATTATLADVLWFAFVRHGEALAAGALVRHVGWHFASDLARARWQRSRASALRDGQAGAYGAALLQAACVAYERFDSAGGAYDAARGAVARLAREAS